MLYRITGEKVAHSHWRCLPLIVLALLLICGCSYYQPTKNVWKSTKGLWNEYVSPPAHVDYDDKGGLSAEAEALSKIMMPVDTRLTRLERVMQNADKPPTQEWLGNFMQQFPWVDGFAGVKYDGVILGQYPPDSLKELDFNPLLYEDKRQSSRALRGDVQPSPLGPEIMLATPLYDGVDFLGIVVAYFEMRSLMRFAENADDVVVLCPTALLWPGKYDFAATPLAGVDWQRVVRESAAGTCSNATGSFFYLVRYLGNLPLVFAIPEKGDFPAGNGDLAQGAAFFPQEREKLPPPPAPERKPARESEVDSFGKSEESGEMSETVQPPEEQSGEEQSPAQQPSEPAREARGRRSGNEIQPGSRDSMLLRKGGVSQRGHVEERQLEGENIEVERAQRPRRPAQRPSAQHEPTGPTLKLLPEPTGPTLPGGRPSPFGPKENTGQITRPSPFGPAGGKIPASESTQTPEAASSPDNADRLADGETSQPENAGARTDNESKPETPASSDARNAGDASEERLADGEKAPADSSTGNVTASPNAGESAQDDEPKRPALLPGGRPSPFGPRK